MIHPHIVRTTTGNEPRRTKKETQSPSTLARAQQHELENLRARLATYEASATEEVTDIPSSAKEFADALLNWIDTAGTMELEDLRRLVACKCTRLQVVLP